jgi:hypothetical protein
VTPSSPEKIQSTTDAGLLNTFGRNEIEVAPISLALLRIVFPQSSSASRFTAGAAGFLNLSQSQERPEIEGDPRRFDTIPLEAELAAMAKHGLAITHRRHTTVYQL